MRASVSSILSSRSSIEIANSSDDPIRRNFPDGTFLFHERDGLAENARAPFCRRGTAGICRHDSPTTLLQRNTSWDFPLRLPPPTAFLMSRLVGIFDIQARKRILDHGEQPRFERRAVRIHRMPEINFQHFQAFLSCGQSKP